MEFFVDNWQAFIGSIGGLGVVSAAVVGFVKFLRHPTGQQLEQVKAWLLGAMTDAEKEWGGGGTGRLKLSAVYGAFLVAFPWLAPLLPFAKFSDLVGDVMVSMTKILSSNKAVQAIVYGEGMAENDK